MRLSPHYLPLSHIPLRLGGQSYNIARAHARHALRIRLAPNPRTNPQPQPHAAGETLPPICGLVTA